ncbi:DUF3889 domain-containing protein [Bacillus sp. HMF5848]|nr:DUF3889 domain-containing protein [Bacillus sp. HMF5848]
MYHYGYQPTRQWYQYPPYFDYQNYNSRQQPIKAQAVWTEGGPVTKCGIPWSKNEYMTVAVTAGAPYECGQTLKVRYPPTGREIIVTVVDQSTGSSPNQLILHKQAFVALGVSPDMGIIPVEFIPTPELEAEKWGKYLLEVTQVAYPGYDITDYNKVEEKKLSADRIQETYEFKVESTQEKLTIRGSVIYNTKTNKVISFDIKEV